MFGIIGVQLFSGSLHHQVLQPNPNPSPFRCMSRCVSSRVTMATPPPPTPRLSSPQCYYDHSITLPLAATLCAATSSSCAASALAIVDSSQLRPVHALTVQWQPLASGVDVPSKLRIALSKDGESYTNYPLVPDSFNGSSVQTGCEALPALSAAARTPFVIPAWALSAATPPVEAKWARIEWDPD